MRPIKFRDCGESIFTHTDRNKLWLSGSATDDWYSGMSEYDFTKHAPKDEFERAASDQFTQLVWKGNESVGFGIRANTVVAWYCKGGNKPLTKSAYM
jgi:hypothetical protein